MRRNLVAYMFILPYLILFLVFRFLPAGAGLALSIMSYSPGSGAEFTGTENFSRLIADDIFWSALRVTLVYTGISVPVTVLVALLLALLAERPVPGIKVFRAAFFLPVITSLIIGGIVFRWLYSANGPLNALLGIVGIGPVAFLQDPVLVLPSIAMLGAWTRFGFDMLILLAGLQAIPTEYHEAAMVDGAGAFQRFFRVTLPLLKPALFFVVLVDLVFAVQVFDAIYVMTGGGPVRASYSLVYMIYDQGFRFFNFGYASAIGVALFVITIAISLVMRRGFKGEGSPT